MTLKRLAAKITPKNAHLITLSDEKSGTMLFKVLKTGVETKAGQSGPLGPGGGLPYETDGDARRKFGI